jgi:hypothetical protein
MSVGRDDLKSWGERSKLPGGLLLKFWDILRLGYYPSGILDRLVNFGNVPVNFGTVPDNPGQ